MRISKRFSKLGMKTMKIDQKKRPVEITIDKDTGEEHVKLNTTLNTTPEEVALAIFSNVRKTDPKLRKRKGKDKHSQVDGS